MPNRVALLRAEIEAAHPGAVVRHRGEAGFSMSLPDGREEHRYTTGPWHWRKRDADPWVEVDTDIEDHPGWAGHVRSARFDTLLAANGARRFVPRRWLPDEWVEFGALQWQTGQGWRGVAHGPRARRENRHHYSRPSHDYEIGFSGRGCRTNLTLKSAAVARPLRWPVTLHGLTWQDGVLIGSDGVRVGFVRPPTWTDASDIIESHPIPWTFADGYVTLTPDLTGAVFPVVVDPDYAIAAGADDGYVVPPSYSAVNPYLAIGLSGTAYSSWMRFAAIAADQEADCSAASIAFVAAYSHSSTTVYSDFYGVDEDDHVAPVDYDPTWLADHAAHTTATVAWDSIPAFTAGATYTSPDISAIFDELFARVGWATGQDVGIHWDDGGSSAGTFRGPASYENTSYTEPVLSLTLAAAETNAQVSPALLSTVSSFPAVTTAAGSSTSPACLSTVSTFPAPTPQAGASFAVACLLTVSSFFAPTTAAGTTTSPAALNTVSTFPAVTTAAGTASSPALLDTTSEFPAAGVQAGWQVTPALLSTVSEFPAVTAQGETAATTSPATLSTVSEFPAPTLAAGTTTSPALLSTVSEFPAPTFAAGQTTSPATLLTTSEYPAVTTAAGGVTSPTVLLTVSEFPTVTLQTGSQTSPAALLTTTEFPAVGAQGETSALPATLNTLSEYPAVTVGAGQQTQPATLNTVSTFPAVTTTAGGVTSPACLNTISEFPAPVARMRLQTAAIITSAEPSSAVVSGEPSRAVVSTLSPSSITGRSRRASITSTEPTTHVDSETP